MPYKILIVDDEEMLTELLSDYLQDCGYTTYVANDSDHALALLQKHPNLILLDINMPGTNGLELCKMIRNYISCPILFLTARVTETDKVVGLRSGGDDYITKPFSFQELAARIEAHLRRDERSQQKTDVIGCHQGLLVDLSSRKVVWRGKEIPFSRREFDIIEFLLSNSNQIFDRERIYEAIWGYDAEGDSNVIKEHIRKIRAKLMNATGNEYIETVWGMGYKWKK
ncbi:MAG TPA: response regulator transcription factor [Candidatus Anaerotignum merdipullorum]|nr:response regulator transcription factor [Candidatus Anaerotignum merdipullorum]